MAPKEQTPLLSTDSKESNQKRISEAASCLSTKKLKPSIIDLTGEPTLQHRKKDSVLQGGQTSSQRSCQLIDLTNDDDDDDDDDDHVSQTERAPNRTFFKDDQGERRRKQSRKAVPLKSPFARPRKRIKLEGNSFPQQGKAIINLDEDEDDLPTIGKRKQRDYSSFSSDRTHERPSVNSSQPLYHKGYKRPLKWSKTLTQLMERNIPADVGKLRGPIADDEPEIEDDLSDYEITIFRETK